MDPRVKLLILILFDVLVIVKGTLTFHLPAFSALVIFSVAFAGVRETWKFLKKFLFMMLTVFVIGWIFISLEEGFLTALRFGELILSSFVFFKKTDADEISRALLALKLPYNFVFIFTSAFRYVELIGVKLREIKEAQQARGLDVSWRNFQVLILPLLVGIFVLADDLAEALESRGFTCKNRTTYDPLKWTWKDSLISVAAILVFLFLIRI